MPYTKMLNTVTSSILHDVRPYQPADDTATPDDQDEQPLADIVASIISQRLRKLEGLRTGIRRVPMARRALKTAPHWATNSDLAQSGALGPPITRLNSQQNFIMGRSCNACTGLEKFVRSKGMTGT